MLALVSSNGGEGSYESHGNLVPNIFPGTCCPCETSCAHCQHVHCPAYPKWGCHGDPPTHTHPWVAGVPLICLQLYLSKELSAIVFLAGDQKQKIKALKPSSFLEGLARFGNECPL